jgi:hypothetical protein
MAQKHRDLARGWQSHLDPNEAAESQPSSPPFGGFQPITSRHSKLSFSGPAAARRSDLQPRGRQGQGGKTCIISLVRSAPILHPIVFHHFVPGQHKILQDAVTHGL